MSYEATSIVSINDEQSSSKMNSFNTSTGKLTHDSLIIKPW